MKLSKHFSLSEWSSPSVREVRRGVRKADYRNRDQVPKHLHKNVRKLAKALELVREQAGAKPLRIASGWRSQAFNGLSKGRATKSQHLVGKAADLVAKHIKPAALYWVIKDLMDAGLIPVGGLAAYPSFVHYDIRGRPARWRAAPLRPRKGPGSKGYV